MKKWLIIVPILLLVLFCTIPAMAGETNDPQQVVSASGTDFYDAVGIGDQYTTTDTVEVYLPDENTFLPQSASSYTVSLWKVGETKMFLQSWANQACDTSVPVSLSGKDPGFYFIRLKSHQGDRDVVNDFYFQIVDSIPASGDPVMTLSSSTIQAGMLNLCVTVQAPGAKSGFIIVGDRVTYFEGEFGFDILSFDEETSVTAYATVFYPEGTAGESVKNTNPQTLTVTSVGDLGTFQVSGFPSAVLSSGDDVNITYSPVTNQPNVPITYYARMYDVTQNWKTVRREVYVSQSSGDSSEKLMGNSSRTLSVASDEFIPGHLYSYTFIAEASGYGMKVCNGFFRAEDTLQSGLNGLGVSIDGETGQVVRQAGIPFDVHISFPNDQFPDDLHIWFNDIEAEYWNWGMARQNWMNNGSADFTWQTGNNDNTVCYVEAVYGGTTYNTFADIQFIGQSNDLPKLTPPEVTLDGAVVTQGEYLTVSVNSSDANAQNTSAYVEDSYYTIYRGNYELVGDTIKIPTLSLEPGMYMLTVVSDADKYDSGNTVMAFRVLPPASPATAMLIADYDHVVPHQQVVLSGYVPGADHVELHFLDGNDEGSWHDQQGNGGQYIETTYSWGASGTENVQLVGYDSNQEVIGTANVTIEIESNVTTAPPILNFPATLVEGTDLTGTFTADEADWVHININLETRGMDRPDFQVHDIDIDKADFSNGITLADDQYDFTAGDVWRLDFDANRYGENSGRATAYVTVVKDVDPQNTVTLTANNENSHLSVLSGENVHVEVNAPGAKALRVWDGGTWQFRAGDSTQFDWSYGDDTMIIAMATYEDRDYENWNYDQYYNTPIIWAGVSNAVNVEVTSYGTLNAPHFQLNGLDVQDTLAWGSFISATVTDAAITDESGTVIDGWYYANLEKQIHMNGNTWWQGVNLWNIVNIHGNEISIPTFQLDGDTRYRISVGADAVGWNGNESRAEFFLGPKNASLQSSFNISVNNVQTQDPVQATAYYEGADWVEIIVIKDGEQGWRDQRSNGGSMVSESFRFGAEGSYTLTAVAHIMEKDSNGMNVETTVTIGTAQTVQVTAPNGSLDPIVLSNIPSLLMVGEGFDGSFNTVNNAEHYYVEVQYQAENGNWPEPLLQKNLDVIPGTAVDTSITIPASMLQTPGRYRVWVCASGTGFNEAGTDWYFRVIEQPAQSSIALTVDGQNGNVTTTASTDIDIAVNAPGASAIRILDQDGNWQYWDSRAFDDQNTFHWIHSLNGGNYQFYAQSCSDYYDWDQMDQNNGWMNFRWEDLDWNAGSNIVSVEVTTQGQTDPAIIAQIGDLERGTMVPITITDVGQAGSATRADWVYAWIESEQGWDMTNGRGQGENISDSSNVYPTFMFPGGHLEAGTYYACVNSSREGYDTTTRKYTFTIVEPQGQAPFIFEVQDEPLFTDLGFNISAYAPGASFIEIVFEQDDGNTFTWDGFQGDFIDLTDARLGTGTYQIHAVAHYMDTNGNEIETRSSGTITRTITSIGKLNDPVIQAAAAYNSTSGMTFTVDGLDQGDWNVEVYDRDIQVQYDYGQGWELVESWEGGPGQIPQAFTIAAGDLIAGHSYQINANVYQQGYDQGNEWITTLVYGDADQGIVLNVDSNGSDLAHWPSSKNLHVTVHAPDSIKAVKIWDREMWQYRDNVYGKDENGDFVIDLSYNDEGDYVIVAMASTDTPPQSGNMEDWESMNWSLTSNAVEIHVEAVDQLPAPNNYSMVSAVKPGQDIVITITNPVQGQWYGATLRRPDGWNESNYIGMDEQTNTITIPTYDLMLQDTHYVVSIWTDKEGWLGNEVLVPIVIDDLSMASVFQLPAALTTVEAEAFAGVSMDVVIVQGNASPLDLSFLDGTGARYVVADPQAVIIPDTASFVVITPEQYNILK